MIASSNPSVTRINLNMPFQVVIALNICGNLAMYILEGVSNIVGLSVLVLFFVAISFVRFNIRLLDLKRYQASLLLSIIILVSLVELVFFGVPLLGSVKYNEFGFFILHHLAISSWVVVLLSRGKIQRVALIYNTVFAILIFNRQAVLLGFLAVLMKVDWRLYMKRLFFFGLLAIVLLSILGSYRSALLGVDFSPFSSYTDFRFLDFPLLYILGPYLIGFEDIQISGLFRVIEPFWNTLPEWKILFRAFPSSLGFVLFYTMVYLGLRLLALEKNLGSRFSALISLILVFSFFSRVIFTTMTLATLMIILTITFFTVKPKT